MNRQQVSIKRAAKAGFNDKGDVLVNISRAKKGTGIKLDMKSKVEDMFGDQIRDTVADVLAESGISDAKVRLEDKGALDYVIRARLMTAIQRATKKKNS